MTPKTVRRLWFWGLWLLLPWPLIILGDGLVPPIRYTILALAASAVALAEGAGGPLPGLVAFFWGWALVTTLGTWIIARLAARLLATASEPVRSRCTLAALLLALLWSLLLEPYSTPFGRAATGGLLEILS